MDISYQYTKVRRTFGRQLMFCEQGPEMCDSIPVNTSEHKLYILRNPIHQPTQNTAQFRIHEANTFRAEYASTGANHAEGGWPRDVIVTDPEATQRYRRKVEKDDGYIHCVMAQANAMDHYILQNNAIDMYETYYTEMECMPALERNSLRTVNVYRDPHLKMGGGRPVSSIAWQPDGGHNFAVTYVDMDYYRNSRSSQDCYIWDLENANSPVVTLTPPHPTLDLRFNPRDLNVLAGGLSSGQVSLWDRRAGGAAVALCPPHVAHRDLVRNVIFISSKSGQEFFSAGPDGECKWWDCRKLDDYIDNMIIDVVKSSNDNPNMATAFGTSVLEYEPTIPTRFMVGTENGLVISGNRKGKSQVDKLTGMIEAHLGPVWSLQRNPGFLKNFLTVGDWTVRVWSEDCRESAIVWSPPLRHKITNAAWSPTRVSLMLVVQWNGQLSAWDLLRRQHAPALTMQLCDDPLLRLANHDQGSLSACGSNSGNVYMVEVSHNLSQSSKNDKTYMTAVRAYKY
ncbi:hypothetical protein evm_010999 [Chilo suppressalis]|nr:hypothetical protein evm_010999 [Chilo suppressalis]